MSSTTSDEDAAGLPAPDGREGVEDSTTTKTATRHPFTNDLIALGLTLSYPSLIGCAAAGWLDLSVVPQDVRTAWVIIVGTATVWAFGVEALEAWRGGK